MMKPYLILIFMWALAMALIVSVGCSTPNKETQLQVVSVPVELPKLVWGLEHKDWTEHLLKELVDKEFIAITPTDYKDWCPSFPALGQKDRALVYAELISMMANRESGFKPWTKYQEAFSDSKGKPVISRGLMQISIESANSYGCGFKEVTELHDPLKNLSCSVKIIERWITRDKRFGGLRNEKWVGISRYWSVMRSKSGSYKIVNGHVKGLGICK